MLLGHFTNSGASPTHPLSAIMRLFGSKKFFKQFWKIVCLGIYPPHRDLLSQLNYPSRYPAPVCTSTPTSLHICVRQICCLLPSYPSGGYRSPCCQITSGSHSNFHPPSYCLSQSQKTATTNLGVLLLSFKSHSNIYQNTTHHVCL